MTCSICQSWARRPSLQTFFAHGLKSPIDERLLDERGRPSLHKQRRMPKIAIVAAIERELWPLIKNWRSVKSEHEGREFTFYESEYAVAVCGGMGAEYGRRAAEA